VVRRGWEEGLFPGAVYLIGRHGRVAVHEWIGHLDPEHERPISGDAIFDMASVTKPVSTAASLMLLLQRGELYLDDSVTSFFPGRTLPHLSGVTLRHLMTHTSGLPAWRDMYSKGQTREETIDLLLSTSLVNPIGAVYTYSCLGYIILGLVVESVSGMSLADFAARNIFRPLGMKDTGYNPNPSKHDRVARTLHCPARKRTLVGEVHDGSAWAMGGVSGNAGLFSTAEDLAEFCHTLLCGGVHHTDRLLAPLVTRQIFEILISPEIGGQSAGWFAYPNDMLPAGDLLSKRTIGHSGFTGTSVVIDPEQDLFVILLTNRVCRDDDGSAFRKCRRIFHNSVAQAIER
jgi:CubicO group peptidase (beta-lactamase class C family)